MGKLRQCAPKCGPVFVVGAPRSGTHLMRFCLSRGDRLYIAPETGFFMKAYGNRRLDPRSAGQLDSDLLVDRLLDRSGDPTMAEVKPYRDRLKAATERCMSYQAFGDRFFSELARIEKRVRWGEKTPLHAFYVDEILRVFPNARVVFMVRSQKNTIASIIKSGHVRMGFHKALATVKIVDIVSRRLQRHEAVLVVHYEDLTSDAEASLKAVCDFIGEDFRTDMLRPGMLDSSYRKETMVFDEAQSIVPDRPDQWAKVLTGPQAELVDALEESAWSRLFSPDAWMVRLELLKMHLRIKKAKLGYFFIGDRISSAKQHATI